MSTKRGRKHRSTSRRWDFDPNGFNSRGKPGRYTLHDEQLANLAIGVERNRSAASVRRRTIGRELAKGRTVADIALIYGYSRAAVYRHLIAMNVKPKVPRKQPSRRITAHSMLAAGKSVEEVARMLGLKPETIRCYKWEMRRYDTMQRDPLLL